MARQATVALIMHAGLEYAQRLTEGAADYLAEHPRLGVMELPYQAGAPCPFPEKGPLPFDGALM